MNSDMYGKVSMVFPSCPIRLFIKHSQPFRMEETLAGPTNSYLANNGNIIIASNRPASLQSGLEMDNLKPINSIPIFVTMCALVFHMPLHISRLLRHRKNLHQKSRLRGKDDQGQGDN